MERFAGGFASLVLETDIVKTSVVAVDGLSPGHDPFGRRMACLERVTAGAIAVLGRYRVCAAKHFPREGAVVVVSKSVLVGAILAEHFDAASKVGSDDDVPVWVSTTGQISRRFFRLRDFGEIRRGRGCRRADTRRSSLFYGRYRGGLRLTAANKSHRRRIAEIIQWIARCAKKLSRLDWSHDGSRDNGRVGFEHFHWPFVLFHLRLAC